MNAIRTLLLTTTLLACSATALAKEGAGDQSVPGAEGFLAGALPPPGSYFVNYLGNYSGTLKNGQGDTVRNGNGQEIKANVTFDVLRFVHVTDFKILGADYAVQAFVPVVHKSVDVFGDKQSATDLGDIFVSPVVLGWHPSKNLHIVGALDVFLKTGRYDKNDHPAKNFGANYYSFEPVLAVSYLADNGFEASAKFMYNIKTKNQATDYQSGDEFHFDYLLGYRQGNWGYGVGGYYLKQTTDDKLNGVKVGSDGNRGQVFAFGPQLSYTSQAGDQFIVKWDHETQVRNRTEGDTVWFKYVHRF